MDFRAEVAPHLSAPEEHLTRCYGWHSYADEGTCYRLSRAASWTDGSWAQVQTLTGPPDTAGKMPATTLRFMQSLQSQDWARIGTMNRRCICRAGVSPHDRPRAHRPTMRTDPSAAVYGEEDYSMARTETFRRTKPVCCPGGKISVTRPSGATRKFPAGTSDHAARFVDHCGRTSANRARAGSGR